MSVTVGATTTLDSTLDTVLFSARIDTDGYWLFVDRQSDVWGRGRSLLEAMCDYWAALYSHLGVLDGERLTPRLKRQVQTMKWLTQVATDPPEQATADGEATPATEGKVI